MGWNYFPNSVKIISTVVTLMERTFQTQSEVMRTVMFNTLEFLINPIAVNVFWSHSTIIPLRIRHPNHSKPLLPLVLQHAIEAFRIYCHRTGCACNWWDHGLLSNERNSNFSRPTSNDCLQHCLHYSLQLPSWREPTRKKSKIHGAIEKQKPGREVASGFSKSQHLLKLGKIDSFLNL